MGSRNMRMPEKTAAMIGALMLEDVPSKPRVRPHSNNTSKKYDILITRGWMNTLEICGAFDFKVSGFRVLILGLGF